MLSFQGRNSVRRGFSYFAVPLAIGSLSFSSSAFSDALDSARSIERQTNQVAQSSQRKIDSNSDQSFQLQAEVEQLQAQVENLTIYQQHLKKLVSSQEQEKTNIDEQLTQIKETRQGVVPLMYHMIDGLEAVIEQGIPVRIDARQQRLASLKILMGRADISDAEKYRRILEAYQIEMDYTAKLGTYQAKIALTDDDQRQVDVLYVGKIALLARSQDTQQAWLWSQDNKQWQSVDSDQLTNINQAFALANKQQAPSLLSIPLSLTSVSPERATQEAK